MRYSFIFLHLAFYFWHLYSTLLVIDYNYHNFPTWFLPFPPTTNSLNPWLIGLQICWTLGSFIEPNCLCCIRGWTTISFTASLVYQCQLMDKETSVRWPKVFWKEILLEKFLSWKSFFSQKSVRVQTVYRLPANGYNYKYPTHGQRHKMSGQGC